MFFKIDVPKNLANFAGKHNCFLVKLAKFLRTPSFTEHLRWLLLSMLLFMNVSSFTSALPHFHYFLTVMLLSSFEVTLWALYHYYYIITIIIAEWFIRIAATTTTYCTAISMIVIRIRVYAETKKIAYEKSITEKYSFIQACNVINLPRMYDFSKFCFKLDKAGADILKKYMQTDLKNDLVTAS